MINYINRYYINTDTNEIITREQFETMMDNYIKENNSDLRHSDVEEYFDEIHYIGKFTNIEDARNEYELSL